MLTSASLRVLPALHPPTPLCDYSDPLTSTHHINHNSDTHSHDYHLGQSFCRSFYDTHYNYGSSSYNTTHALLPNTSTPSGIRNAVTKLRSTGLIKTRLTGSLAYRGWHTASTGQPLPLPEQQKRMASRHCNGCGTTYSKFWRSDKQQQDGWLCNNCGMNQRRGRGISRVGSSSSLDLSYTSAQSTPLSAKPRQQAPSSIDTSFVTRSNSDSNSASINTAMTSTERTRMMDINQLCCSPDKESPTIPQGKGGMGQTLQKHFSYPVFEAYSPNNGFCASHSTTTINNDLFSSRGSIESLLNATDDSLCDLKLPMSPPALLTLTTSIDTTMSSTSPIKSAPCTPGMPSMAVSTPMTDVHTLSPTDPECTILETTAATSLATQAITPPNPTIAPRRPPTFSVVDPSKRKCGNCGTAKSAGKWRRDREILDSYLCNKCGMNQRRAQLRSEQQSQLLLHNQKVRGQRQDSTPQLLLQQQQPPLLPTSPPAAYCQQEQKQQEQEKEQKQQEQEQKQQQQQEQQEQEQQQQQQRAQSSQQPSPLQTTQLPQLPPIASLLCASPVTPAVPALPNMLVFGRSSSMSSICEDVMTPRQTRSASRPKRSAPSPCSAEPSIASSCKKRRTSLAACHICRECLPSMEVSTCKHRLCGECIPLYIRRSLKCESIYCPACVAGSPLYCDQDTTRPASTPHCATMVPVLKLGQFLDSL
ncbi:hypothetical protein BASA50_002913 [Batrachochytrium salamandrivorans]|uniref:GATA-type domain-containing protein n=1 Tax=Batrachochytrium salamandrivorans TaxID=1357716 RepID=A0ABQ8FJX1_9FUNG|nr:hypothetical protein BASA50_002913 [Batrachochytrium salamandrivorans]KAH9276897.1 hypothetical protein BASA83_000409 [Batrachochytrium salamandrivorans]